jgi:hypothetical protein
VGDEHVRQTRLREKEVATGRDSAFTLGVPGACGEDNRRRMPRSLVVFEPRDEFNTVHGSRQENLAHDHGDARSDAQTVVRHRKRKRRETFVAKELGVHIAVVSFRLKEQDDVVRVAM